MWRWALALVLSLGLAFGATGPKLYKMARIKGWLAGAVVTPAVVTQKGVDRPQGRRDFEDTYWVSWGRGDPRGSWAERERLSPEDWELVQVGDPIELISVPGESGVYLRNGVFVDPGNFAFDAVLFAAAIAVAVGSVVRLLWRRPKTSGAQPR